MAVAGDWLPEMYARNVSWLRRRDQYASWLEEEGAFVLVARRGPLAVGYAMVHMRGGSPTWQLGERAGELETLSVLANERGHGAGRLLLLEVRSRLRDLEATELSLHVLCGNEAAERFYEREGFKSFAVWLTSPVSDPPQDDGG
jgi:ribosomal protein S18 acetylase RimI-like enzyme